VTGLLEFTGEVAGELGGPLAMACAVMPSRCTRRVPVSMTTVTYRRWSVSTQSTWKKSVASSVAAWARKKADQGSSRCADGGMR
jgi:hypothetical protein